MRKLNTALLLLLLAGQAFAGVTNLDRLELTPENATGNALTVEDSSGVATFTVDASGDVTATGAQTFSGAVTFSSTIDLGSTAPSAVTSRTVFLGAGEIDFGTTGSSEIKNNKATIALADASADEHIYISWGLPDDFDKSDSHVHVKVLYMCDQASPTEGEWDLTYLAVGDDDADAALGNEVTVLDTSPAQNDWSLTGEMLVPSTAITSTDTTLQLDVYHDVSDQLCGGEDVNVLGVQIGYTTDSNY